MRAIEIPVAHGAKHGPRVEIPCREQELASKIKYLVDYMDGLGLLEDGSFTFPDGDTWGGRQWGGVISTTTRRSPG